jgi:transcriptional regulator with XRE-family HTH domain
LTTIYKLGQKLRDAEYRKAFVASQINIGIPFQLRALLKSRCKTQEWLAEKAGMLQPRISGLLTPGKTRPNIETLRRLAEAFDCGLIVRFASFSEVAKWSEDFDPESFNVPTFDADPGFIDRKPVGNTFLFQRSEQPPLEAAQGNSKLVFIQRPAQALTTQPSQTLAGYAGAQR